MAVLARTREWLIVRRATRRGYIDSRHATPLLMLKLPPHIAVRLTDDQSAAINLADMIDDAWGPAFVEVDAAEERAKARDDDDKDGMVCT
jgi:hypothetical protein